LVVAVVVAAEINIEVQHFLMRMPPANGAKSQEKAAIFDSGRR